jgi:hypothetical protein
VLFRSGKDENAMEEAITKTFSYFGEKYPDLFSSENRKKTIDQWKKEIQKYAVRDLSELDGYWVGEFGEQFGISSLEKYKKKGKITDKDEIMKVLKKMQSVL